MLFGGNIETKAEPAAAPVVMAPVAGQSETTTGFSTLTELAEQGRDLECTLRYEPENDSVNAVTGTYFTSNGQVRGDFMVPGQADGSVSSLILSQDTVYSWSIIEGEGYGVKIPAETWSALALDPNAGASPAPIPASVPLEYSCKPWVTLDNSVFVPPSDILFKEYEALMNTGMEYGTVFEAGTGAMNTSCELCEQITPGEGQDSCRANFNCPR